MVKLRVSPSKISAFRECRRRWDWQNQYESKYPAKPLWLGRLVHEGLDTYYANSRDIAKALTIYDEESDEAIQQIKSDFPRIWHNIEKEWFELFRLGRQMLQTYDRYEQDNPLPGKVLETEKYLRVKLPFNANGLDVDLTVSGRIDLVMEHRGVPYIVDHKTSSSSPRFSGLSIDEQMTAYSYLYWRDTGEIPDQIIYNVLLKKVPEEPRILKSGKVSKAKNQSTSPRLYRQTLEALGQDKKDYVEFLGYLDEVGYSKYFERGESIRTNASLKNFQRRVAYVALDMIKCQEDEGFIYPNPSTFRCGWCPFQSPCRVKEDAGDYQYILDQEFRPQ